MACFLGESGERAPGAVLEILRGLSWRISEGWFWRVCGYNGCRTFRLGLGGLVESFRLVGSDFGVLRVL